MGTNYKLRRNNGISDERRLDALEKLLAAPAGHKYHERIVVRERSHGHGGGAAQSTSDTSAKWFGWETYPTLREALDAHIRRTEG